MNHFTCERATAADHDALIDFINYVFSHAYDPTDFPTMLPKLYKKEYDIARHHFVVKEDGQIKATVGAYPMRLQVCGESLKVCGIGAVSVHPYARSKGYMKALMNEALAAMRDEGVALAFLGGQKQRYEYFGFTPAGTELTFTCTAANMRHWFSREGAKQAALSDAGLSFKEITSPDDDALDEVYRLHTAKKAYVIRPRENLYDIMISWRNRLFGIYREEKMIGYVGAWPDLNGIHEICTADHTGLTEIVGAYLQQMKINEVRVKCAAFETEKIEALIGPAESMEAGQAYNYAVLDYPAVLKAFLTLKNKTAPLPDGCLTVRIQGRTCVKISVRDRIPAVYETEDAPDYTLTPLEATRLFFSHSSAFSVGVMNGNAFARCVFPLPLFMEGSDQV